MCIIVYKPKDTDFPAKKVLKECFSSNSDGAGFMYVMNGQVVIDKGYMGFNSFWKALRKARLKAGDNVPYVMHFRISTQGGVKSELCHPYPLSNVMDDLRQLQCTSDMGIAHNGVIYLTSSYNNKLDYNDTMKFITDYLSLIIKDKNYYKDKSTVKLIEKLVESKLAILGSDGHCELIGSFIEDGGCYYSNSTYKRAKATTTAKPYSWYDSYYSKSKTQYNDIVGSEPISTYNCSYEIYGDDMYCEYCIDYDTCPFFSGYDNDIDFD